MVQEGSTARMKSEFSWFVDNGGRADSSGTGNFLHGSVLGES